MFALRNKKTGKFLGVDCSKVVEEDSVSVSYQFSDFCPEIPVWLVERHDQAVVALNQDTPWYNASYETPQHFRGLSKEDYEVVDVKVVVNEREIECM